MVNKYIDSNNNISMLGIFKYMDDVLNTVSRLKENGYTSIEVLSPLVRCEIEMELEPPKSPVRFFTLGGAITGFVTGILLVTGLAFLYPLQTSSKPIISIPPMLIISFELTILFGAIGTFIGFILYSILPSIFKRYPNDHRFTDSHFGVYVRCSKEDLPNIRQIVESFQPEEVQIGQ